MIRRPPDAPGRSWTRRMLHRLSASTRLQRLLGLFIALVLGAVWISVFALLDAQRTSALAAERRQNANIARVLQEQTVRVIAAVDQAVLRLAAAAASGPVAKDDYKHFADSTGLPLDILVQLSLIDAQGRFVGSNIDPSGSKTGHLDLSLREHVRVHLRPSETPEPVRALLSNGGLFIGKPVLGKVSAQWTIQLSRAVHSADGQVAGAVVASLNPGYFEDVYRQVALGLHGSVSLVGTDAVVRARVLGGVSDGIGKTLGENSALRRQVLGIEGAVDGLSTLTARERVGAYHKVGNYPLYVFSIASTEEALQTWRNTRHLVVALAALLSAAVLGAGWLFVASVRRLEAQHRALQRSEAEARSANQAKTEFLAAISHELRTPLTSICGFAELMERRGSDERVREQAMLIRKASEHLHALLSEILDLATVESGAMVFNNDVLDVVEVVNSITAPFLASASAKGLDLSTAFTQDLPATLCADSLRLRQILNNLLSNAIKFTPKGRVSTTVEHADGCWRFHVADTGPGIPAHLHETIFEKFRQADARVSYEHGGTGLGLALSRALAQRMGGDVTISSAVGLGSKFTLTLPDACAGSATAEAHAAPA